MKGINRAHLIGSIVHEPLFSYTFRGVAVLELTIANRLAFPTVTGTVERNSYTRVKLFGSYGERLAPNVVVGKVVEVFGRVESSHVRGEDGRYNEYVVVIADTLLTLADDFSFVHDSKGQPVLQGGTNRITLGGNVARGVYRQTISNGEPAIRFTLAVDEALQGREGRVNFVRVNAWSELATRAAGATKGTPLIVSGRLLTDTYTLPEGERAYTTYVAAEALNVVAYASGDTRAASIQAPLLEADPAQAA